MTDKTSVADWSTTADDNDNIAAVFPGAFRTRQSQWTWQNDIDTPLGVALAGLEQREQKVEVSKKTDTCQPDAGACRSRR